MNRIRMVMIMAREKVLAKLINLCFFAVPSSPDYVNIFLVYDEFAILSEIRVEWQKVVSALRFKKCDNNNTNTTIQSEKLHPHISWYIAMCMCITGIIAIFRNFASWPERFTSTS